MEALFNNSLFNQSEFNQGPDSNVNLQINISGKSTVELDVLKVSFSFDEQVIISCSSTVYVKLNVKEAIDYSTLGNVIGNRRRNVTYKYKVITDPISNISFLDNHFNLLSLFSSFQHVEQARNYVEREATQDIIEIVNDYNRSWLNGYVIDPFGNLGDLANISQYDRGYVQQNATGEFKNKDGVFAIYIGKDYNYNDFNIEGE